MIGLLQSDIKAALKTAFANMDGPLPVIDWCRGRSNIAESAAMEDAYSFQYTPGDAREGSSSIPIGGDAMSPAQSSSDRGIHAAIYIMTCPLVFHFMLQV
jgi:mediator of RNA polymerase II transcription subunit 13